MLNQYPLSSLWISLYTLWWKKEVLRFLRIWSQTLLPPAITMSLYFIIFGKFIGSQISPIHGFRYIQYIAPGLIFMSIITNAYSNTAASFFTSKFNKSIEEMIIAPMPNVIILLGFTLGGTLRGILTGLIVIVITLFFTHIPLHQPFFIMLMSFLSAVLFSLAGLINGIYAKRFDDISFIPTFVLTPLTYLGGIFFSLSQLPFFWRSLTLFNPIFDMIDSFRYGFLGVSDINPYIGMILLLGLTSFLFCWAWWLLAKGVGIKQ